MPERLDLGIKIEVLAWTRVIGRRVLRLEQAFIIEFYQS